MIKGVTMNMTTQTTSALNGTFTPPGSKSEAIRALFIAALSKGTSKVNNVPDSEDVADAIRCCEALGASIHRNGSVVNIIGQSIPFINTPECINTGNSGITTRFILPLLGLRERAESPIRVDCGDQMRARPIRGLMAALRQLGMRITCLEKPDSFPFMISGTLLGGQVTVEEPISQYVSALLNALPLAPIASEIHVANLVSRPYVNITKIFLDKQKINYSHVTALDTDIFNIKPNQQYQSFEYTLPGDFSSASYFIAAGLMFPGTICIEGLDINDTQGDKALIDIARQMGADIAVHEHHIMIHGGKPLQGISIDIEHAPDLLPTLAVLGTYANGKTEINNAAQARLKETDRIHSMTEGLRRMGAHILEKSDSMHIHGSTLKSANINGYGDHRTVMAMTLAGMRAEGRTMIQGAQAIQKTFPTFVNDMQRLGAALEWHHG